MSEVVGSMLTVAITVVLMAAVFALFLKIPGPEDTVHADLTVEADPGSGGWGTGDEHVVVTHKGGEALAQQTTTIRLTIDQNQTEIMGDALGFDDGVLTIGQRWRSPAFTIGATAPLDVAIVGGGSVIATGGVGRSAAALPSIRPLAPTLTAQGANAQVSLAWTTPAPGSSPLTGYNLYRGTASGAETLLTSVGLVNAYADTGLVNGQAYYYVIGAVNGAGEGALSLEVSATPGTVPGAPTGLATTRGDQWVNLTWTAPASNGGSPLTSYAVWRGTVSGGPYSFVANVSASQTWHNSTGLTNGQAYYFVVYAWNGIGPSLASAQVSGTPVALPGAPTSLTAVNSDAGPNHKITLNWLAPASNGGSPVTAYKAYRGTSPTALALLTAGTCANLGATVTCIDSNALTHGTTYYYQVTAVTANGEGPASNTASASG